MICVYPADCKDFSNNGLGIVLPQSCTVTETLNGEWELTLIHPIDVDGKWTRLTEGCILRAPVPAAMTPQVGLVTQQYQTTVYDILIYKVSTQRDPLRLRSGPGTDYRILSKYAKETEIIVLDKSNSGWYEVTCPDGKHGYISSEYLTYVRTDTGLNQSNVGFHNQTIEARQLRDQPFRIYRVVPELDKVTVYARHVFYDLLDNMIKSLKPSPDAVGASVVQSLSASCLSAHGFNFYSDLTSSAEDVEWENKNPVEAMLGEGGLVEKYGAELARDWFDVFLVQRVGNDSDVQIRERKNMTGISYDVDEKDVVTRIMPTGQDADGDILYLPELYLDSPNIGAYVHPKWIHLSVSEAKEVTDGDEPRSREECFALMRQAAQAEYDKGCDLPTVTLKVEFVNCADTEEYRQYAALSNIFLGDSVRVIARRIGVEVSMRMTQYTYDCLTRRYTSVTLGRGTTKVTPTVGTVSGMRTGMTVTKGSASSNEIPLSIAVAANATLGGAGQQQGEILVPITAPVSTTLRIAWSKVNTGATGAAGADAVMFSLYAPSGTVFVNGSGTLTIQTAAYKGTTAIISGATYVWKKYVSGTWQTISGQTGSSLSVEGSTVDGVASFQCVMTYGGKTYTDTISLTDKTDNYQASIESSGGDVFKNSVGSSTLLCRLFQNGQEVDTDGSAHTYKWYRRDKDGNAMDSGGVFATGKSIAIDGDDVDVKTTFICEVT